MHRFLPFQYVELGNVDCHCGSSFLVPSKRSLHDTVSCRLSLHTVFAVSSFASSILACRYLAYIYLYHGIRALNQHVYPQHCRRSVPPSRVAVMTVPHKHAHRTNLYEYAAAGLAGREQLHTFQPDCTRQQTLILLAITFLRVILMGLPASGKLCPKSQHAFANR